MSLYDYQAALALSKEDQPFYALIMAAMLKADSNNVELLREIFPETWRELEARYHAPGGLLSTEEKNGVHNQASG